MMAEEFGPWIEHDGSGCPLPLGMKVRIEFRCGCQVSDMIEPIDHSGNDWKVNESPLLLCNYCGAKREVGTSVISKYALIRPRALTQLIELVETLPAQPEEVSA